MTNGRSGYSRLVRAAALLFAVAAVTGCTLDLYGQPEGTGYPVLIFIHGGGWNSYDKELFTPVAMQLLPQEMVVVIPDYTLYPDAAYRQMAREVADASPETYAPLGGPRAWLIHGDADETVPLAESEAMRSALRAAGVEAELIVYPGAGHSDFLFGALRDDSARVILDIGRIVRE